MRLRFITSIPDFIEGRVIEIPADSQQAIDWLRAGVAVAEKSLEEETTLAPAAVERAVARRLGTARHSRKPRKAAAVAVAEDD